MWTQTHKYEQHKDGGSEPMTIDRVDEDSEGEGSEEEEGDA